MNYGKHGRQKKEQQLTSPFKKTVYFISSLLVKLVVFGLILAAVLGASAGIGGYKAIIDGAPSVDTILEDVQPEGYTTIIYDLNGTEIQRLAGADANRIYVDYDQIPKHMRDAVVAVEDERFWKHNGFDLEGFMRAIVTNVKEKSFSEGASTITQQVVKMNILKDKKKKIKRKLREQYLAVQLEKKLAEKSSNEQAKKKILELYLNSAPFGRNTNGVQTAARLYFNKDISEITIAEAAAIAAITNRPTKYDPVSNPKNNQQRQQRILKKMWEQGYISEGHYQDALKENIYENIKIVNQQFHQKSNYTYFVDETIQRVANDLVIQKGYTEGQAFNLIYRGGLSIYVTQDLAMQKSMDGIFTEEKNFPPQKEDYELKLLYSLSTKVEGVTKHHYKEESFKTKEKAMTYITEYKKELGVTDKEVLAENALFIPQPQAAMVVMDYYTGHIKALTGGRGQKVGNQTFNRATQAKRQPGSTFKILAAYAPALDARDYTLATVIDDAPTAIRMSGGSTYRPGNWYRGYKGLSTVREGIINSMNILAVKTVHDITPELAFDYLQNFGFTTLVRSGKKNDMTLSLPLGGLTHGVTPLELTAAYGAIANQGVYTEPILYTKVLDHDGTILLKNEPETRTVIKKTTAFLLTNAMVDVITKGTGTTARLKNMNAAGKTGTTQNTKDLWFAGYTPYYAAAIWMGYDDPKRMAYVRGYHKYIWRDVMNAIHKDLPNKAFSVPEGIVQSSICTESGLRPAEGLCNNDPRGSTVRYEYFAQGTVPTETCDIHKEVLICKISGLFANEFCPPEEVEKRVMIQRRPTDIPEDWDLTKMLPVADAKYEIPYSMEGEYCDIHKPGIFIAPGADPFKDKDDLNSDGNNQPINSEDNSEDNGEGNNSNNENNSNNGGNTSEITNNLPDFNDSLSD